MTGRILVEDRPGYPGWAWVDVTDQPMPTVGAQRSRRIMLKEDTGFNGHRPVDITDIPHPAISTQDRSSFYSFEPGAPARTDAKPAYSIPPTADILATPASGYRAVGTFSGCGGSSLGLTWAGIKMIRAYEFDPLAAQSYAANFPTPVDVIDLHVLTAADVLASCGLAAGELDIFEGSPPCSKFSMAGKREKSWNKVTGSDSTIEQANVEDLFFEWIRILRGVKPRIALAENVHGLAIGKAKGHLKMIVAAMRDAGYRVAVWDLDAQWLGVPQRRRRLIFVGVRDDLAGFPVKPSPLPYRYTVADALPHLVGAEVVGGTDNGPSPTIMSSVTVGSGWMSGQQGTIIERSPLVLDDGYAQGVTSVNSPAATVRSCTLKLRPADAEYTADTARQFTIAELRRICGFPDDYKLIGSHSQQWARLGNAVMPLMYRAVGTSLVNFLRSVDQ